MWGVIDNNSEKWGKVINGYTIHSPKDLVGSDVEIVLIASQSHPEIFQQLSELLYSNVNILKNTYLLYEDIIDKKRIDKAMDEYRYSVGLKKPVFL